MVIINCPECSGPIAKFEDMQMDKISMSMKCPHCRKPASVRIMLETIIMVNGRKMDSVPEGSARLAR